MNEKKKPILFWITAGLILALSITLAVLNWKVTSLHLIFVEVQGRLIFILIIFFLLGFILGKLSHLISSRKKDKKVDEYVTFVEDGKK
ncbi:MAG: DUF1049 domain-containing protein [Bacteroidetes bacterium]|nr:MAG: DUF1049 domain-containing protein [Bacteroidota bacterium]